MCEPDPQDPYDRGDNSKMEPYIQIERRLAPEKISRTLLLNDERTKQLEILTRPNGTNFRVTKLEEAVIESILDGSYMQIPAIDRQKMECPDLGG